MARLPRLCLPGLPHLMRQRGHSDAAVFLDDADRQTYHAALREAAALQRLPVHAYALLRSEVRLLITPDQPDSLGRLLQSVGRRYGAAFNRRHGRSGGLWEGRFRATVVEPGLELLGAMGWVEGAPHRAGLVVRAQDWPWSSARHHLGQAREPWLVDPAEYWALGNTPFDRETVWQRQLEEGQGEAQAQRFDDASRRGWPLGSGAFLAQVAASTDRPVSPRPRGRPPRVVG
ncbi:MAG: transposase [Burkholderiales bacterium]|jgi:putative transposase|nr:transposase [Burkholderiales bacterium]MBP7518990.1 transposase [Leptothrix sp. (in: b-proteobacteria)]